MKLPSTLEFVKKMQRDMRIKDYKNTEEAQAQSLLSEVYCKDIIQALEKQIPKKPFKDYCWHCPNCEEEVYWDTECGQQKFRYCHNCGQKIDWNQERNEG